jgi:Zn-dependent metalloprotease
LTIFLRWRILSATWFKTHFGADDVGLAKRYLPLAALLAACSPSENNLQGPKPGLFDAQDQEAYEMAEDLAVSWLEEQTRNALAGVDDFALRSVTLDHLGMAHVRVDQLQDGVPVFGGDSIVHLDPMGKGTLTDSFVRGIRVDTNPVVRSEDAIAKALLVHEGEIDDYSADLQVQRLADGDHLAWQVKLFDLQTDEPTMPVVFVDAQSGEILWSYDDLQTVKTRKTYTANNNTLLPGTLKRSEGSTDIGDLPVDSAHNYAGTTYDYYNLEQGRDSYDALGATITSSAHYSTNYDNAFWSGSQMVYGDGATVFYPLSQALDVVAHELTHAVTDFSADLVYANESGGLNEATSDIMGAVVEAYANSWVINTDTWKIGEDIIKPAFGTALRFMDNPPLDGASIDNYANYTAGMDVHYSSGIANKAFYLMEQDAALDMNGAGDIWYRALTLYMTTSTTFEGARTATINAATDLYGAGSAAVTAVGSAWTSVGVYGPLTYTPFSTQAGLGASTNAQTNYQFVTPSGATAVKFEIAGGTGDADLYVKFGSAPTLTSYDCRPYLNGNTENCTFVPASSGTYHVMLVAYSTYSGVTLTASSAGGTPVEVCTDAIDNDLDGLTDCLDADCSADIACAPAEVCTDAIDNDLDGLTDCLDADCSADPACVVACPGGSFSGNLSLTNKSDEYQDAVARNGVFEANLTGDVGTDFDLYLEYLSGTKWRTRASSLGGTSTEYVFYNEGSTVLHRWKVKRWSGTGDYDLCVQ